MKDKLIGMLNADPEEADESQQNSVFEAGPADAVAE